MPTDAERPSGTADDHEPPPASGATVLSIRLAITRADIPGLREQLLVLLTESDAAVVVCDVGAIADPDMATIEALAMLHLTAQRRGRRIQLQDAGHHLQHLLALTGLHDVLSRRPDH